MTVYPYTQKHSRLIVKIKNLSVQQHSTTVGEQLQSNELNKVVSFVRFVLTLTDSLTQLVLMHE